MELVHESILTELKASGKLPTPAGVALTILELTRNPDSSTEDINLVLKGDPSLSGQILKYANSAASGCREEVSTVNDALVRLGMKMVQQLCLGFSILSTSRHGQCAGFDYPLYWARSLARGVSAQVLSATLGGVNAEEGFTCGLLAEIGSLGLASVYPGEYTEILRDWNRGSSAELSAMESREFSIHRHQVTCALFEDWRLPETFGKAALLLDLDELPTAPIDRAELTRPRQLAYLLGLADLAAGICTTTGLEQDQLVLRFLEVGAALGIPEQEWIETHDLIRAEWERMGQVLDIQTQNQPAMSRLKRRAAESEKSGELKDFEENGAVGRTEEEELLIGSPDPAGIDDSILQTTTGLDILVANDNPIEQRILLNKLSEVGHRVHFASDGQEALERAMQTSPQVILANWSLGKINGLELARMLRQSEQTQGTYLIIMTSNEDRESLVEAFEAGIDDYLVKPLNHDVLDARLKAAARLVQLQEQSARDREILRQNVLKMGKLTRQLQVMALEDQLTALPNRRAGLEQFDKEWSRAMRNESTLICMILDIDHFKGVNDTYGHDVGDVVLQRTAAALKTAIRDSDTVCRFGGEEFLLICPEADLQMAMKIGDRVRRTIEENHIQCPGYDGGVTVSIGVALRGPEHESPQALVKQADEALYAAKENGRNKVCIYSD